MKRKKRIVTQKYQKKNQNKDSGATTKGIQKEKILKLMTENIPQIMSDTEPQIQGS